MEQTFDGKLLEIARRLTETVDVTDWRSEPPGSTDTFSVVFDTLKVVVLDDDAIGLFAMDGTILHAVRDKGDSEVVETLYQLVRHKVLNIDARLDLILQHLESL